MQIPPARTRGQLEADLSQVIIQFKREFTGRGPLQVRTYLLDDVALVRLRGVLTVAEQRLAALPERGIQLVRQMQQELLDHGRPLLEKAVADVLGVAVRGVYTDVNPEADERIIVFSLAARPAFVASPREPRPRREEEGCGTRLTGAGQSRIITA